MCEQLYIAVNKTLGAGCGKNLDKRILVLVYGFTNDCIRNIVIVGNTHITSYHCLDSGSVGNLLGLGEHKLLIEYRT